MFELAASDITNMDVYIANCYRHGLPMDYDMEYCHLVEPSIYEHCLLIFSSDYVNESLFRIMR